MSEHLTIPDPALASPVHGSDRSTKAAARSKFGRFRSSIASTGLFDPIRSRRKTPATPVPSNQHSGSLKYEHVHRIEITITLLAGIVGGPRRRVRVNIRPANRADS